VTQPAKGVEGLNGAAGRSSVASPRGAAGAPPGLSGTGSDGTLPPGPWYKRRTFIVGAVVVAVLAVTVVTDLPQHASRGIQISTDTTVMQQVNQYLSPCAYAVNETFTIFQEHTDHQLTASDEATAPGLLRDDQVACSLTDESMFNLGNVEVPGSAAGKQLQQLVGTVTLWATSDALAAIEAIQTLWTDPSNASARQQLSKAERTLTSDRKAALANLATADHVLDAHLPVLKMPQLPTPS